VAGRKSQEEGAKKDDAAEQGEPPWLGYVAAGSGLLALMGAMIYGLGLFALWLYLSRTYQYDFATEWYAISLIPRTAVAGHGIRQLLTPPALALAGYLITVVGYPHIVPSNARRSRIFALFEITVSALAIVVSLLGFFQWLTQDIPMSSIGWLAFGIWCGIAGSDRLRRWDERLSHPRSETHSDQIRSDQTQSIGRAEILIDSIGNRFGVIGLMALLFVVFFVLNLAYTIASPTASAMLPTVQVTGGPVSGESKLLAHTDGFWYVVDRNGDLVAIPDDEVQDLRVSARDE
jgi:hypothetical protein